MAGMFGVFKGTACIAGRLAQSLLPACKQGILGLRPTLNTLAPGLQCRQLSSGLTVGLRSQGPIIAARPTLATPITTQRTLSSLCARIPESRSLLGGSPMAGGSPMLGGTPLLGRSSPVLTHQPVRTRTMYSRRGGRPRTVKAVIDRFFRLHNGMWIRPQAGRNKRKWKKSPRRLARLQHHVFCTRRQCQNLDRMVNKYYKMPTAYPEDPYAPYHSKRNLPEYNVYKPQFLP